MHAAMQQPLRTNVGSEDSRPPRSWAPRIKKFVVIACGLMLCLGLGLGFGTTARASQTATLTLTSWETMWIDSNKPDAEGPQSGFLSFLVTNTGTERLDDVVVTFSGFSSTTYFKNPADLTRQFNSMDPGEVVPVYFYVDYTAADSPALSATYSLTVTSSTSGSTTLASHNGTVTSASSISANAGGSDVTNVLGPGIYVGQILTQTVNYRYGNNTATSFQPLGISGFPDAVFRLVGNELTGISGYASGAGKAPTGIAVGDHDMLYWPSSNVPDSGTVFTMVYYWEVLSAGTVTALRPWADATSGTQYKYLYKTTESALPAAQQAAIAVTKSVTPMELDTNTSDGGYGPGIVKYTVTFTNTSTAPNAVPIAVTKIVDSLPTGFHMVDSTYGATSAEVSQLLNEGAALRRGRHRLLGRTWRPLEREALHGRQRGDGSRRLFDHDRVPGERRGLRARGLCELGPGIRGIGMDATGDRQCHDKRGPHDGRCLRLRGTYRRRPGARHVEDRR